MTLKTPTIHGERVYIDAGKCGNEARFINHTCESNCKVTEFQSCDGPHIVTMVQMPVWQREMYRQTAVMLPQQSDISICGFSFLVSASNNARFTNKNTEVLVGHG
ncbi:hypothetical protein F442_06304 [Phytophthora nicotianae P10297]|uniref:SET domain-containing protein n=1 Tax=Phytophthora nicotianae P10297 TaxID=1317064 RepID=W2ZLG3_PHYNI|nr:hypothetical protein F442_06304 [Phytophthora nicotianae P10297]